MKTGLILILLAMGCSATSQAGQGDTTEDPATLTESEQTQLWVNKGIAAHKNDDLMGAIEWYSKAANKQHPDAQAALGYIYLRSGDVDSAVPLLLAAASQGQVMATFELSILYAHGIGVEQNKAKAIELLLQAVEKEYLPAYQVLALAYEQGGIGLTTDISKAVQYYQQGSAKGNVTSTHRLIDAYQHGELGFEVDLSKVKELEDFISENALNKTKNP
jgi:uncharacterized protein